MIKNPAFFRIVISICIAFSIGVFLLGIYDGFDLTIFLILASFILTGLSAYFKLRKVTKK